MEALRVIVFDNSSSPSLFLRAKCLECIGTLVRNFEQDKFNEHEVFGLVESLVSIEGKLSDTDHLARYVILKALDHFCKCQRVNIDQLIDQTMLMLLRYAQLDLCLTTSMPMDLSLDDDDDDDDDDDEHLVEKVRVKASNILLSCCAERSAEKFPPNVLTVTNFFLRCIGCSSFKTRKAGMLALPKLLPLIEEGIIPEKDKTDVTRRITVSLSEALGKETDNGLSKRMLRLLPKCIKTSGIFANVQLIRIIVDGINQALKKIMENEIKREKEAGTSEEEGDFLPTQETIKDAGSLIETTTEKFQNRLSIYIDRLMNNVVLFLETNMPARVIVFAISIFNILVPQFPEKLPPHHNKYIVAACHALRNGIPHSQPHAIRAIGICAEFGKDHFNPDLAKDSVSRLYDVVIKRSGDITGCDNNDMAVEALGKICEYHNGKIEGGSMVVRNWLNFLPLNLKHDIHAARSAHELLSRLIRRSDADLFGTANVNLPKIISVVREEAIDLMTEFINQHS
ncbi:hypothetical protein P8452_19533 [Trifolium repens]|nr:hypothetical protein P8452_19533 [Trifolium repens]